ncbi:CBS domain-containing protein [Desulfohalotomaculum tongense]|uniref:CBS domain-containing protein n=1 Tax=Desulforadius tongensis TaxID=1216062 RepID=UPI00195D6F13|nr:CBS domain-containing protein [Desulforadius tongensis]MBM7854648.1 CBS domain-containing protein [Desulforadius tongensis]
MHDRLVKEVMVPINEYSTINMNATIGEAIKILKKTFKKEANDILTGHRSIIVLDNKKDIVGILTLRSLLKAIEMEANKNSPLSTIASWALFFTKNKIGQHVHIQVKDIMRSVDIAYVYENETITKAVHMILSKQVNSLPVLEKPEASELTMGEYPLNYNKVVGIIRTIDIFNIIGDILELDNDKIITFPSKSV